MLEEKKRKQIYKRKHEAWFCVAIIMQIHTGRSRCSSARRKILAAN